MLPASGSIGFQLIEPAIAGAADGSKFEHLDSADFEELFDTLRDWNAQLKNSDFEVWERDSGENSFPEGPQI